MDCVTAQGAAPKTQRCYNERQAPESGPSEWKEADRDPRSPRAAAGGTQKALLDVRPWRHQSATRSLIPLARPRGDRSQTLTYVQRAARPRGRSINPSSLHYFPSRLSANSGQEYHGPRIDVKAPCQGPLVLPSAAARLPGSPAGISPAGPHTSAREPLDSYGSCRPASGTALLYLQRTNS